jgi:hypothetical protein
MRALFIVGTGIFGVFAIQWLLSASRKPALKGDQLEEGVHELKGKFRTLDEVQLEAATTGGDYSGYPDSLHNRFR